MVITGSIPTLACLTMQSKSFVACLQEATHASVLTSTRPRCQTFLGEKVEMAGIQICAEASKSPTTPWALCSLHFCECSVWRPVKTSLILASILSPGMTMLGEAIRNPSNCWVTTRMNSQRLITSLKSLKMVAGLEDPRPRPFSTLSLPSFHNCQSQTFFPSIMGYHTKPLALKLDLYASNDLLNCSLPLFLSYLVCKDMINVNTILAIF